MGAEGSTTAVIQAPAGAVFDAITDIARLPEWNEIMTRVTDAPETLEPGSEWVVEFKAMGSSWLSRSRAEVVDRDGGRFAYRSMTHDGNPSYAIWTWELDGTGDSTRVTVSWDLHPATFWRRVLLARIRARQLKKEIPASLAALERVAAPSEPSPN